MAGTFDLTERIYVRLRRPDEAEVPDEERAAAVAW
jgi:hypothetical protein